MNGICNLSIPSPAQNENPSELKFIRLGRCLTASLDANAEPDTTTKFRAAILAARHGYKDR
jgi:hypothetical protein